MKQTIILCVAAFLAWVTPVHAQEVFPPNGVFPAGWAQTPGSNASWAVANDFASEGTFSLKSAPIGISQTAGVQITREFGAGNMTFRLKLSTEKFGDHFRFYVNGQEEVNYARTGILDWATLTYRIPVRGTYEFRFVYVKDDSVAAPLDAVWIDAVQFPPLVPPVLKPNDLNGDGKSDVLLGYVNGGAYTYLMNGASVMGGAFALPVGSPWTVTHVADFNGDGKADLLLKDAAGNIAMQIMNGATPVSAAMIVSAGATPQLASVVADLDGDGKADIVVERPGDFASVLYMDGTTIIGGGQLFPGQQQETPRPFPVFTHAADIDGNGAIDVVLRSTGNSAGGTFGAFFSGGGQNVSSAILPMPFDAGWKISHLADLNGDGRADFILRHTDGRIYAYLSAPTGGSSPGESIILGAGTGWALTEAVDLNGDGKADLVFTHTDGSVFAYLMNGLSSIGGGFILGPNSGWRIAKSGDFNGDGKSDLLFKFTDGSLFIYLMSGLTPIGGALVLGGNTGWVPVP